MKIKLILIILISSKLNAQVIQGGANGGMAKTGVVLSNIWSINSNQAGMVAVKRPEIALNYQKSYNGLPISAESAIGILPFKKKGCIGLGFNRYGFEAYRQQQIGLAYAQSFGPAFSAAISLNFHQIIIQNYGKTKAYAIDAGMLYHLNKSISLGAHLSNVNKSTFKQQMIYADIPMSIEFGIAYHASQQILLALALNQTLNQTPDVNLGLAYQAISLITLRGGLSVNPFREYAGLGLNLTPCKLDISFASQQALGYSTQLSLSYAF